jgi:hypothetical protein
MAVFALALLLIGHPLLLFVDKSAFFSWPILIRPRVRDDPSIVAQFQRALSENFAMELRHNKKLAISSRPHNKGGPLWSAGAAHRRLDSIERCVDVLARARIVDMQSLFVEYQGHVSMLLKVVRIPPLACKIIGPRPSGKMI